MTPLAALALTQLALAATCAYFLLVPALIIWAGTCALHYLGIFPHRLTLNRFFGIY